MRASYKRNKLAVKTFGYITNSRVFSFIKDCLKDNIRNELSETQKLTLFVLYWQM